ncbi:MAG: VWA domain-containing protein [Anaerolineae bacterium]|nr:VWA domain-containing protein [Anaerolineae bacterium]
MDRYRGFELSSVCWGYRDIFQTTLDGLLEQGVIGEDRPEVTDAFFSLMRCAEQQHFDYVLKEFLGALNPRTAWLMELPEIFTEVTQTGRELAQTKLHYGITYFRTLGQGGFGRTPQQVRHLITALKRLRTVDDDLAMAFLAGYGSLSRQLKPPEIDIYVKQGLRAYHQNATTGLRFMAGDLRTSEMIIRSLTQEARLEDMSGNLAALLRALVGYDVEIADLGRLDSDDLIERGTQMVCLYRWLYLPARVRHFETVAQNRNWYRLCAVVAAGMLSLDTFSRIHGHPDYATCVDLVGDEPLWLNCFQILEYVRGLRGIRRMWPGAQRLLALGIETESAGGASVSPADQLLLDLLSQDVVGVISGPDDVWVPLLRIADTSVNVFETVDMMTQDLLEAVAKAYPGLDRWPLRPWAFLPDFLYPGGVSSPPADSLVADLKARAQRHQENREQQMDDQALQQQTPGDSDADRPEDEEARAGGVRAAYVYDEWSQEENDYYRNYCYVTELRPSLRVRAELPEDIAALAQRTRRIFELLRPELTKEKYLAAGDEINIDLLTAHLVSRHQEPAPRVDFYEKPYHNRRDLATLILLDVSGSTGSEVERLKTIEIEQRAALILGHGLAALGDRFAISGFSGTGREQCEFFVYKDFDEAWDREAIGSVLAAHPRSATRIGAALRHAGYRLSAVAAKQRVILLITDGKPMDTGYDPNTRYAQYDVRMACQENQRQAIHTFCISTDENSLADMEVMFPEHRYVILPDVTKLPQVLPQLYVRLTA